MIFDLSKIELEDSDLNVLHDVILNASGESLPVDEIMLHWWKLDDDIKLDCLKWGISDTEVRGSIYECVIKNPIKKI